MTVSIPSKTERDHRVDHENFGDIYKVHYKEGIIKDFGVSDYTLFTLDDTCTVEIDGGPVSGVPILYHCRKGFYDDDVSTKRGSGALNHAAWAFRAGQKVKVMMYEDKPYAVIGHNEPPVYGNDLKAPRKCLDLCRLQWHRQIGTGRAPYQPPMMPVKDWWLNWFMYQQDWHSIHYRCSTQEEYCEKNEPPVEPDGTLAEFPHRGRHIMGMREQQFGTTVFYIGDWMLVIGPVAYFFNVYSIGAALPITGSVSVRASVWTPEKHEIWMENARRKEEAYGPGGHFNPVNTSLFTDFPYVDTHPQPKFTNTMMNRFALTGAGHDSPKWILSEFWTYDWDRVATDPGTPNTPNG